MAWKETASNNHLSFIGFVVHTVVRFLQLVLALTVLGLYGTDLNNARIAHVYADSNWVFAEVTGGLAALAALIFMIPFLKTTTLFGVDIVLFILWAAVFGVFGKMYIHANPQGDSGIQRMKNAVWVDLVNMLLWLMSAAYGACMFFFGRTKRSLHTGRATV